MRPGTEKAPTRRHFQGPDYAGGKTIGERTPTALFSERQTFCTQQPTLLHQLNGLMQLPSFGSLSSHVHVLTIGYLPSIDEVIIIS